MKRWTSRESVLVVCFLLLVVGSRFTVAGQESRPREDVLQSLLAEVQGLRAALEQMASAGPRVQLAMGRLQIQEQRVSNERRRLDGLRDSISNAERELADARDQLTMMEERAPRATEPAERESLAAQMKMTKAMLALKSVEIQRLREQEAELNGIVATEESRWTEISQRLDELERALGPRR